MQYLVKAKFIPGREQLLRDDLFAGRIAKGRLHAAALTDALKDATIDSEGTVQLLVDCSCATPVEKEKIDLNKYFVILSADEAAAQPPGELLWDFLQNYRDAPSEEVPGVEELSAEGEAAAEETASAVDEESEEDVEGSETGSEDTGSAEDDEPV